MNICFSVSNLELGGAQMFVTRLAAQLAQNKSFRVFIYDHQPELRDRQLEKIISTHVRLASFSESALIRWFTWKANALLRAMGLHNEFRHALNRTRFRKFLHRNRINVLNSQSSFSDFVCARTSFPPNCAFVITLHGEYELILKESPTAAFFTEKIKAAIKKTQAVIYTAEKNLGAIAALPQKNKLYKISVGIDRASLPVVPIKRSSLALTSGDFVVGMVGRGIEEKGWDNAIAAVQACNKSSNRPIKLILIGNGAYLRQLILSKADHNIIHLPFKSGISDYYSYYSLFDVFIFPSRFAGESVPNAIIESLSWNVPVLATRHAEVPAMLEENTQTPAGICVALSNVHEELVNRLLELRDNKNLREKLSANCSKAFRKFDLKKITDDYVQVFIAASDLKGGTCSIP